jgi:molybdenum cofactor cytidylyltransferase
VNTDYLSAIILSAGSSRRMGAFKPLLPLGGTTVVERVVNLYRSARIGDICIVAGHRADELRKTPGLQNVRWVVNRAYADGMYSSLVLGLRDLPDLCRGFFVHPVDIPMVKRSTLAALITASARYPADVLHPSFDGRRGHPPLIPASLIAAVLDWPGSGGLRAFWQSGNTPMRNVPVADEGILLDLDTEEDYHRLTARCKNEDLPTAAECRSLMAEVLAVPAAVQTHCCKVAEVAVKIAEALMQAGASLDVDLVRSAALVHDIARDRPNHAEAGARLLEELDYTRVAAVVRMHMDIAADSGQAPDEARVVFLADKLVVDGRLATLEERFGRKTAKHGTNARALAAIEKRREAAESIQAGVERFSGKPMRAILTRIDDNGAATA